MPERYFQGNDGPSFRPWIRVPSEILEKSLDFIYDSPHKAYGTGSLHMLRMMGKGDG